MALSGDHFSWGTLCENAERVGRPRIAREAPRRATREHRADESSTSSPVGTLIPLCERSRAQWIMAIGYQAYAALAALFLCPRGKKPMHILRRERVATASVRRRWIPQGGWPRSVGRPAGVSGG